MKATSAPVQHLRFTAKRCGHWGHYNPYVTLKTKTECIIYFAHKKEAFIIDMASAQRENGYPFDC